MKYICVLGSFWLCQAQWEIGHRCYLLFGCHPSLFALPVTQPCHQKLSMEHSSGPAQISALCFSHFPPSAWMDWHLLEAIKTFEGSFCMRFMLEGSTCLHIFLNTYLSVICPTETCRKFILSSPANALATLQWTLPWPYNTPNMALYILAIFVYSMQQKWDQAT